MKRRRFIATCVVSAAFTGGMLTACNQGGTGTADSDGAQTLVMATSADYPPYEFVETSGGTEEIVGFDVDIARGIAERLGYEVEINNIDFNGLIPALQAGRADFVMAGMTPTEDRKQNVDFSEIYYEAQQTIVSQQNSGISTPEDLAGKQIGVQLGSIQERLAKDLQEEGGIAMEIVQLNRINEIVQEIKAGRIDAAIIEDAVAEGFLQANPDLQVAVIPAEGPSGSAIAFPKDSELVDDFNTALAEMQASGEIEELVNKWFRDRGN
ncbi:transporter substrate-binding domain-containing protein [Pseudanabaena sp. FACHB-2040]|uniref:transporter substrate-binding domain-containing protein n=1 Tax=Pseudanabaena sp. FACHB-2040 TaxID=2692859 RepID=UPI001687D978|nr:transporter substrate-binding domain-containing protein [Pseudanabaena sp. FACHB-2040]MBD2260221.1 transporter substrate-binding domain-containing protein [Pseudanabaena sp. FACHB-2040]